MLHPISWLAMLVGALYWVTTFFVLLPIRRYRYKHSTTQSTDLTIREQFLYEAVSYFVSTATWEQYNKLLSIHHGIEDMLFKPISIQFSHNSLTGHWYGTTLKHTVQPVTDHNQSHNVLLYFHGGGFRTGGSGMYPSFYMDLSRIVYKRSGVDTHVLSINYQLTSEHIKCPTPVDEGYAAYQYLINVLHIKPSRIIIGGDSAGTSYNYIHTHNIMYNTLTPIHP